MEWFSGSIPEAITLSKSQNSIFVVFITDGSEASAATEACLGRADTGLKQSSVAIKLASNSEEAQQFNQIYPILVLPSLYFINPSNGVPVEILAGAVTDENLAAKIPTILKDCTSQNSDPDDACSYHNSSSLLLTPQMLVPVIPKINPAVRAYGTRSQARYRQEGNIHRLGNDDDDDDDDENNTWNGNSTQQM
ncbi:Thioredoxin-like fold [Trinorchestia longiramus]|nr:Thioredoxin-like fold [Trinorchestia longiramus]